MSWQAGVFGFTQDYEQDAVNSYAAGLVQPVREVPCLEAHSAGHGRRLRPGGIRQHDIHVQQPGGLTLGARADRERKTADLRTYFDPAIAPEGSVTSEKCLEQRVPSASLAYRVNDNHMIYASGSRGFKAGGYNPARPPTAPRSMRSTPGTRKAA